MPEYWAEAHLQIYPTSTSGGRTDILIRIHQLSDGCHRRILAKMSIGTKSLRIFLLDRRRHRQHWRRLIQLLNTLLDLMFIDVFTVLLMRLKRSGTSPPFSFDLSAYPQRHEELYIFGLRDIITRFKIGINNSIPFLFLLPWHCTPILKSNPLPRMLNSFCMVKHYFIQAVVDSRPKSHSG